MLPLLVMALSMAVQVGGERCGEDDLGFMCQDPPICWDQVENYNGFGVTNSFFRSLPAMANFSVLTGQMKEKKR